MTEAVLKADAVPTWVLAVGAVAVLGLLGGVLSYQKAARERPLREAQAEQAQLYDEARLTVVARLKDPGSAQFTELRQLGYGPDRRVCGYVNAKNSFGGYTGAERFVVMAGSAYIGEDRPSAVIWSRAEHPCDVF